MLLEKFIERRKWYNSYSMYEKNGAAEQNQNRNYVDIVKKSINKIFVVVFFFYLNQPK